VYGSCAGFAQSFPLTRLRAQSKANTEGQGVEAYQGEGKKAPLRLSLHSLPSNLGKKSHRGTSCPYGTGFPCTGAFKCGIAVVREA